MNNTNTTKIQKILAQKELDGSSRIWQKRLKAVTAADVERALSRPAGSYRLEWLATLISPAAEDYLEQMAQTAHNLTVQRFGRTISLYAPLYLSNYCMNSCRYCGFNKENKFPRTRLTIEHALEEAELLAAEGFKDILLVSGEDRKSISVSYLAELVPRLRSKFSSVSIEVYPMSTEEYATLFEAGVDGVTLYQETYDRRAYARYHPAGPKSDYDNRLNATDRIAASGMREVGLGALLGLTNWRPEILALAEHADYLIRKYWQSRVSFSFPRLKTAYEVAGSQFKHPLSDKNLVQIIIALRLCFGDVGLVLSTRERAELRDRLITLGITKLSAGSKTSPGGYSCPSGSLEQFEVDDNRSSSQITDVVKQAGYQPVWKDGDIAFVKN